MVFKNDFKLTIKLCFQSPISSWQVSNIFWLNFVFSQIILETPNCTFNFNNLLTCLTVSGEHFRPTIDYMDASSFIDYSQSHKSTVKQLIVKQ